MFSWVSHPPTPLGSFSPQDPGMGRESPGLEPTRPPSSLQGHLQGQKCTWELGPHCPLPLYQELRMAEGVAVHIPVLLTLGP